MGYPLAVHGVERADVMHAKSSASSIATDKECIAGYPECIHLVGKRYPWIDVYALLAGVGNGRRYRKMGPSRAQGAVWPRLVWAGNIAAGPPPPLARA
jgi:hypothetical protein